MKTRTLSILGIVLLLIVGLLYFLMPNFGGNDSQLTGSVGRLAQNDVITFPTQDITVTRGQVLTLTWKSKKQTADLYLLPETTKLKLVEIASDVTGQSFTYVIPESLKAGNYFLVVNAGKQIKSQGRIKVTELIQNTENNSLSITTKPEETSFEILLNSGGGN